MDLQVGILEDFAEAQLWYWRSSSDRAFEDRLRMPLGSIQRAYRERNAAAGVCRSCPRATVDGMKVCAVHREANRLRAQRARGRSSQQSSKGEP